MTVKMEKKNNIWVFFEVLFLCEEDGCRIRAYALHVYFSLDGFFNFIFRLHM